MAGWNETKREGMEELRKKWNKEGRDDCKIKLKKEEWLK